MLPVILGAGPAGLSCANALLSFGLQSIVIERGEPIGGAQRANFHPNLWLLGAPAGESGRDMTARIARHFETLPIALYRHTELLNLAGAAGRLELTLRTPEEGLELLASTLVLATGSRPRSNPDLEMLAAATNRVHIGPLDEAARDCYRDAHILILGGGDNALDHALLLAEQGCAVEVCARHGFSARPHFLAEAAGRASIRLHEGCAISGLEPGTITGIDASFGKRHERFDALIVLWGYQPNSDIIERFAPHLRPHRLPGGHIVTDRWQRSTIAGLYAAGDVTDTPQPSIAVAIAQGLTAARAIEQDQRTQRAVD